MSTALLLKSSNVKLSPELVRAVNDAIPIELGNSNVELASQIITYSCGLSKNGGSGFSVEEFTNFHPDNSKGMESALNSSMYSESGNPFDGVGSANISLNTTERTFGVFGTAETIGFPK